MVAPKTEEAIELLRWNGQLTSQTLAEVGKWVAPGVTTAKLNEVAETFIRDHGAVPNFLDYDGYPYAICTSVNDVVVHGFPSDKVVLQEGDIVSVDLGTLYKGYNGDSAYTCGGGGRRNPEAPGCHQGIPLQRNRAGGCGQSYRRYRTRGAIICRVIRVWGRT